MGKSGLSCRVGARVALCLILLAGLGTAAARADESWWNQNLEYQGAVSNLPGTTVDVQVSGGRAYLRAETEYNNPGYVAIIDVDNAKKPKVMATWHPEGRLADIAAEGNRLYALFDTQLSIMDFKNPSKPRTLGTCWSNSMFQSLKVVGNRGYLIDGGYSFKIVDFSDPAKPETLSSFNAVSAPSLISDIAISGDHAFLACYNGIYVLNIADPKNPKQEKFLWLGRSESSSDRRTKIAVCGDKLFVYQPNYTNLNIVVFKWTLPAAQAQLTTYDSLLTYFNGGLYNITNIEVSRSSLFIPVISRGVQVISVADIYSNDFMKGYYLTPSDALAVRVCGSLVYVATGRRGLTILKFKE